MERYNGWTNYETWCVNLWMGNSEGDYGYWTERAETLKVDEWDGDMDHMSAKLALASELEDQYNEMVSETNLTGPLADLLSASVESVNWHEIAGSWVDDAEVELPEIEAATA